MGGSTTSWGPGPACFFLLLLTVTVWAQPPTRLVVALWNTGIGGERELVSELVRGFQRENPDIMLCTEWRSSDQAREMIRRWTGSYRQQAPDLTVVTDLWLPEMGASLAELPEGLQATVSGLFPPSVLARVPSGSKVVGVPWVVATEALYYRSDLMSQAGLHPPESFEELAECAAKLADPPRRYGLGVPGAGWGGEELVHVLAAAQGEIERNDAGSIEPNQPPFASALTLLQTLQSRGGVQPEVLTWSEAELAELMIRGRLAMMLARPWLGIMLDRAEAARQLELRECQKLGEAGQARAAELQAAKIEWDTAPLPVANGGAGHLTVDWLVLFRTSNSPQAAHRFLAWLAHDDRQRALAMLGGVPATVRLARQCAAEPRWRGHLVGLETARGLPIEQWAQLRPRLGEALGYVISGRLSPQEALSQAAAMP